MTAINRLLVTGARGFLGSHIVKRAQTEGIDVVPTGRAFSDHDSVCLDVCDRNGVDAVFARTRPSIVIHCAAYGVNYAEQDVHAALAVNVHGSLCMLEAAARHDVKRFVHVGSCFEYGTKSEPIDEDAVLSPSAIYGATKAAATLLLIERAQALGVSLIVARPFGMWGVGEAAYRLVPQVIAACVSRSPLRLTPCEVVRDLTYVEDMAACILKLAQLQDLRTGTIVNVGSGEGILLRDFVRSIARILGGEELMHFGALNYRPTEMQSLVADVTRMHQLIGVPPRTLLAEGISRMVGENVASRIA